MTPQIFKESNRELQRPANMTPQECGPLPVFTDGNVCVSRWGMSFKERLHCLIKGFLWVRVHSGETQPPIVITAAKTIFE